MSRWTTSGASSRDGSSLWWWQIIDGLLSNSGSANPPSHMSTMKFVFYGSILGFAVDMLIYPADVVKTRVQFSRKVRILRHGSTMQP